MFLLQKKRKEICKLCTVLIRSCRKMKRRSFGSCALPPTGFCLDFATPAAAPAVQLDSSPSTENNSEPKLGSECALIEML